MPKTYAAILKGDRVEWLGESPPDASAPVKVSITVLSDDLAGRDAAGGESATDVLADLARRGGVKHTPLPDEPRRKARMLDTLDALAEQDAFAEMGDASERQLAPRETQIAIPAAIAQHAEELARLCAEYNVLRLELFGSAVSGAFWPQHSDLDFLVEFRPLQPGAYADSYFGLLAALERLFGRPVDLVAAKAIKNPYFLESVNQTRTLVYEA